VPLNTISLVINGTLDGYSWMVIPTHILQISHKLVVGDLVDVTVVIKGKKLVAKTK
jgi:hypothetical protein